MDIVKRRNFIKGSAALALGTAAAPLFAQSVKKSQPSDLFIIGPKEGFTPAIGTLVSMMNWTRKITTVWIDSLKKEELDYLMDEKANSIGALVLHIIVQEKECQVRTFSWDRAKVFDEKDKLVSKLGDNTRQSIKGNDVHYYLDALSEVREKTLSELKKRDDSWLMEVDNDHPWGNPVNNYCDWFHVVEHECQHAGQIALIKNRLPK